ncbi:histidine kinase [Streptomyces incarnatus]|uniref:histidine kinase n=1 Tax=Streptomyces incarnatus TaxID=665007 RepID=A0ABN4G863_9ACTN|nr:sensor histidine kinase [Streptomyces incarnatus]AKJ09564.1 histidine kinase [Streptomyces incarnatus]
MTAVAQPPEAHRRSRITVQGWFHLALTVMIALVITGSVVGAELLARTARVSDELIEQIQPARSEAYQLQAALLNQESGARGYAIAADPQFLTPYTDGKRAERESAGRLHALIGNRAGLREDLDAIERAAADWRRTYAEPLVAGVTPGKPRPVDQAATERGKKAFDHIRTLFTAQTDHLARARERGQSELAHVRTVRDWVLGGMVALFLLTGIVLAVLVRTLVARPLDTLRTGSRRVAEGEFGHRISVGGPADIQAMGRDIEAMRQRLVAELDASRAQQDVLTRQAADLDDQAVELRRSNAELEQFAYVASHDLQEPLRKVASFCQLLEKRFGDQLDDRGKQYIAFAVDGAKRMQILINDLLTFSRVGRVNDAHLPVPLGRSLDKALDNLAAGVEETGARIERPEQLPAIMGDPTLLVMLWQNLLGNAVKFRHPDRAPEVRITCEPAPDADPDTPGWLLCVSDNGIGIPEEFAEKVFVIFQRLHGRDAYSGTGIGLALCKKIVEFHGGHIWIDTDYTGGTRFCFTLPSDSGAGPDSEDMPVGTALEGNRA